MSGLLDLVPFGTVVQFFLCLNCHLLVEIQEFVLGLCLHGDVFDLLDDFQHRTILCGVHFLGIASGVGSTSKSWETEKSWWYELAKTNWSSETMISLCDMRSLGMAGRVISLGNCSKHSKCVLKKQLSASGEDG
ncbi:hypothetical protein ACFX1X_013672 [Malus domestica]